MELFRPSLFTAFAIVLAVIPFVNGYYSGNNRFNNWLNRASNYEAMGDIAWKKRNIGSYMKQSKRYSSPNWGYASMADADWGWKKRSAEPSVDPKDLYDFYKTHKLTSDYWKRFGQSYYVPYSSYTSSAYSPYYTGYKPRSSPVVANAQQRTRNANRDRMNNYVSMADVDWGWKRKRSEVAPQQVTDEEYDAAIEKLLNELSGDDVTDGVEKKNIASLVRNRDYYVKRSGEGENSEKAEEEPKLEDKRFVGSVLKNRQTRFLGSVLDNRPTRNGGISALARQGYLPTNYY